MERGHWNKPRQLTRRAFFRAAITVTGAAALGPLVTGGAGGRRSPANRASSPAPIVEAKPVQGGTLTVRSFSDVSNLDYAFTSDVFSAFVLANCVEPLLTLDTQSQPKGLLVTSWENPDDHTYVFKLRQGVKFQDGTNFNAEAVEYSLNRIRNDKASVRYQDLTYIDKIERPDPATVRLTLARPHAPFLYSLCRSPGSVISPAIGEKYGKDRLKTDLTGQGSGPFKFIEWKAADHVTLVRNDSYWGKDNAGRALPYLDRIVIRVIPDDTVALAALRSGEIDAFAPGEGPPPKDTSSVKSDSSLAYAAIPGLGFSYMVFNQAKKPFSSKPLRQAVSYAIDREAITKTVWFDQALPLDVVFAPSSWVNDPDYHPYLKRDLNKAKQLLSQAGKAGGFTFTYLASAGSSTGRQTAELIKDQLGEAGIQMEIQEVEFAKLSQTLTSGGHQVGSLSWLVSTPEPDSLVYAHFSTKGSQVAASHCNSPQVDNLLDQARTELGPTKRKALYQQAQRIFMDDAVFCILYDREAIDLSSNKVKNYPLGPTPAVGVSQVWKSP